ncbi:MAG: hypothetical protein ACRDPA_34350, partial [Solirubrobacteraceae bacterium]
AGERLAEQALEHGRSAGQRDAELIYRIQRSFVSRIRDPGPDQIEMTRRAVAAFPRMAAWQAALADLESLIGRPETAAELLEDAIGTRWQHIGWDMSRTLTIVFYVEAAVRLSLTDAAASLYDLLAPCHDQFVWDGTAGRGHVRMWLGLLAATLGRASEADDHLAFSIDFHERN